MPLCLTHIYLHTFADVTRHAGAATKTINNSYSLNLPLRKMFGVVAIFGDYAPFSDSETVKKSEYVKIFSYRDVPGSPLIFNFCDFFCGHSVSFVGLTDVDRPVVFQNCCTVRSRSAFVCVKRPASAAPD
jgi:hypothetical protein